MLPNVERRPLHKGGALGDELSGYVGISVADRRRRAAALRLPPRGHGPADPLDDLAGQPVRAPQRCHGAEFTAGGRVRPCSCRGAG
jgi:hypothetical protein